jgi:hypothetical protein
VSQGQFDSIIFVFEGEEMTKYNSTKYRVIPFMEWLGKDPIRLRDFLFDFFSISTPFSTILESSFGSNEKMLKPTKRHLLALVDHYSEVKQTTSFVPMRQKLVSSNQDERRNAILLAKKEINDNYDRLRPSTKAWYILEGFTHPDIFIETDSFVIVGEAKWTETHLTNETEHLKSKNGEQRSQMVRHIQAALNYSTKPVIAFYIVDSGCGYLCDLSKQSFMDQISKETIRLDKKEENNVFSSYRGFTTWEDISEKHGEIRFLTKSEIDALI